MNVIIISYHFFCFAEIQRIFSFSMLKYFSQGCHICCYKHKIYWQANR